MEDVKINSFEPVCKVCGKVGVIEITDIDSKEEFVQFRCKGCGVVEKIWVVIIE